ncbi:MAG TPA: S8 family serine peptidase [Pseudonocardiaceae bacterium]|jgi:subtilase family serine protease
MRRISITVAVALIGLAVPTASAQATPIAASGHGLAPTCPFCQSEVVTTAPGSDSPLSTPTPAGYGPADLAAAYHLPPQQVGRHGTIAILDAGYYPKLESDLAVYRTQFGLPPCTTADGCLRVISYDGGPLDPPATVEQDKIYEGESSTETALDFDMASAACPECQLVEVQLPLHDAVDGTQQHRDQAMLAFGKATTTAVSAGADAVSISMDVPSDAMSNQGAAASLMAHPGVPVLAASGDGGFQGATHTSWPQNLPWVISVGGTSLHDDNGSYTQAAWRYAGSGCETDVGPAIGQPAQVSGYCGGHRASADISAIADPDTGIAAYDSYRPIPGKPADWMVIGGTSVATPFVAGLFARAGHLAGVFGPNTLYAAPPDTFTNVVTGSNAAPCPPPVVLCQAGPGWNGPTGVGTPNGLRGL